MKHMREWKFAKTATCFCDIRKSWCRLYIRGSSQLKDKGHSTMGWPTQI